MKEFLLHWKQQLVEIWQGLSKKQRGIIIGSVILVLLGMGMLINWASNPHYMPLFTDLSTQDAGAVVEKLQEKNIEYRLEDGGSTIVVPQKEVYGLRVNLANEGLPKGKAGFSRFDAGKLGETDTDKQVKYHIALKEELETSLEQIVGVDAAVVNMVVPKETLFVDEQKDATASVLLKISPGKQLNQEQIKGIVHLVARGVEGLEPENVTVVDQNGIILSENIGEESNFQSNQFTVDQLEIRKQFNENLEKDIKNMLEKVFGMGKVTAKVNADINLDHSTVDEVQYTPPMEDGGIARSVEEIKESFNGNGSAIPGGVPGTESNLSGYQATDDGKNTEYEHTEGTTNFEINEKKIHSILSPGTINKISVAVIVSSDLNAQQQKVIGNLVGGVVGYDEARGDQIVVQGMNFNTQIQDQFKEQFAANEKEQERNQLLLTLGAIAILVTGLGVVLVMRRRRKQEDIIGEEISISTAMEDAEHLNDDIEIEELSPEDAKRKKIHQEIKDLVNTQPENVVQILKVWLSED